MIFNLLVIIDRVLHRFSGKDFFTAVVVINLLIVFCIASQVVLLWFVTVASAPNYGINSSGYEPNCLISITV